MKFFYALGATAWLANVILWAVHAHVPFMAVVSLAACGFAMYLAREE